MRYTPPAFPVTPAKAGSSSRIGSMSFVDDYSDMAFDEDEPELEAKMASLKVSRPLRLRLAQLMSSSRIGQREVFCTLTTLARLKQLPLQQSKRYQILQHALLPFQSIRRLLYRLLSTLPSLLCLMVDQLRGLEQIRSEVERRRLIVCRNCINILKTRRRITRTYSISRHMVVCILSVMPPGLTIQVGKCRRDYNSLSDHILHPLMMTMRLKWIPSPKLTIVSMWKTSRPSCSETKRRLSALISISSLINWSHQRPARHYRPHVMNWYVTYFGGSC
jgi:hypothetical protein